VRLWLTILFSVLAAGSHGQTSGIPRLENQISLPVKIIDLTYLNDYAGKISGSYPSVQDDLTTRRSLEVSRAELRSYRQEELPDYANAIQKFCEVLQDEDREIVSIVAIDRSAVGATAEQKDRLSLIRKLRMSCLTATASPDRNSRDERYWKLYSRLEKKSALDHRSVSTRIDNCRLSGNSMC
jgi:hypothetical protein